MKVRNVAFYENQRIKTWSSYLPIIPITLLFIAGCILQIGFGKSWGNNPMPDAVLIIVSGVLLLISINIFFVHLTTTIDRNGVYIRMQLCPFYTMTASFLWDDISESSIIKHNPVKEHISLVRINVFGFRMKAGSVSYRISGDKRFQLKLKNGKMIFIGTNNPDELSETLRKLGKA